MGIFSNLINYNDPTDLLSARATKVTNVKCYWSKKEKKFLESSETFYVLSYVAKNTF